MPGHVGVPEPEPVVALSFGEDDLDVRGLLDAGCRVLEQIAPRAGEPLELLGPEHLTGDDENVVLVQQRHEQLTNLFGGHRAKVETLDTSAEVGAGLGHREFAHGP